MYPKQRPVPPEVSSWMEKDLAMGELTAASRLLTNDARQNIIVSRRFFSDLLTLSFERYRKILACDYDKKTFLKNQRAKSETSMPGLRPYVDKLSFDIAGITTSEVQSNKNETNSFASPSSQSLFSRPETKSDLTFNRRPHTSMQRIKTAQSMRSQPETISIPATPKKPIYQRPQTGQPMAHEGLRFSAQPMRAKSDITPIIASKKPTHQRPVTRQQISRERLDYLAQPKHYRFKSAGTNHIRPNMVEQAATSEELFGGFEKKPQTPLEQLHEDLLKKCDNAVRGDCFRQLVDGFSKVHHPETSNVQTVGNLIQNNPSLQDTKGRWKMVRPTAANSRPIFKNRHQTLADKLNNKIDVFLIDVGA